jgi:uncharacterized metal-binding protein YceD (DUF177 family)
MSISTPLVIPFSSFDKGRFQENLILSPAQLDLDSPDPNLPVQFLSDIKIALDIRQMLEGQLFVKARMDYRVELECVTCLDRFGVDRADSLEMIYYHERDRPERVPCEDGGFEMEDPDIGYYSQPELDLEDEIVGKIFQELPEYPRCKPDCRGLDPATGLNLDDIDPAIVPPKESFEPAWKQQLRSIKIEN